MKSYKDIDKQIILNAPEGAMWVFEWYIPNFYKLEAGKIYFCNKNDPFTWNESTCNVLDIQTSSAIPLPNVEIPWEAKEGGVCPVPKDIVGTVQLEIDFDYDTEVRQLSAFNWEGDYTGITSYKIVDEEYLPSERVEQAHTTPEAFGVIADEKEAIDSNLISFDDLLQKTNSIPGLFITFNDGVCKVEFMNMGVEPCSSEQLYATIAAIKTLNDIGVVEI